MPNLDKQIEELEKEVTKWKGIAKSSIDAAEDSFRQWYTSQENCKKWKEVAKDLYESIGEGAASVYIACTNYQNTLDNLP